MAKGAMGSSPPFCRLLLLGLEGSLLPWMRGWVKCPRELCFEANGARPHLMGCPALLFPLIRLFVMFNYAVRYFPFFYG